MIDHKIDPTKNLDTFLTQLIGSMNVFRYNQGLIKHSG